MKILGIVILYHPDDAAAGRIASYLPVLEKLLIWDNTPGGGQAARCIPPGTPREKCIVCGTGANEGIGRPLNEAVRRAAAEGCTHLMTFDQDSRFLPGEARRYVDRVAELEAGGEAVFSTNYLLESQGTALYPADGSVREVPSCMTSGSIYPLSLFRRVGLFREDFFIWGVDMEFSYRARRAGVPSLCISDVLLQHGFGAQRRRRRLLGREVFPNEYAPARTYYNVRNGFLLHRLFPAELPLGPHLKYHLFKRFVFVLLYEQQKAAKCRALLCGLLDGLRGRAGKWRRQRD